MIVKKIYITTLALSMLLASCTKEIDIDYHTVDALYVIESTISNEGTTATISKTLDVEGGTTYQKVNDATVTISGSDGSAIQLVNQGNGIYTAENTATQEVEYTFNAAIPTNDGTTAVTTSATSTMQPAINIISHDMYYVKMQEKPMYMYQIKLEDDGNDERYYYINILRNGEPYVWNVHRNLSAYNDTLTINTACFYESDNADDEEKEDEWLFDGDEVEVSISRIDKPVYDYLYSLNLSERTNSNPVAMFSNGVLGYFSARSISRLGTYIFRKESITEM